MVGAPDGRRDELGTRPELVAENSTARGNIAMTGLRFSGHTAPRYTHSSSFRCGKEPMTPAGEVADVTDEAPQLTVTPLPNSPTVIIEVHHEIAHEGELGKGVDVLGITLPPACMGEPAPRPRLSIPIPNAFVAHESPFAPNVGQ